MKIFPLFFVCLFFTGVPSDNAARAQTTKTQIRIDELPGREGNHVSAIHDWIDQLEWEGYLINVPRDVVDLWRSPDFRNYVDPGDILKTIEAYNSVEPKNYDDLRREFQVRGRALPDGTYQELLVRWRQYESFGDDGYFLAELEAFKQQLAFLDGLTDEQWGYIEAEGVHYFTGFPTSYDLETFKSLVGMYAPLIGVPTPPDDLANFYAFRLDSHSWPVLVLKYTENGSSFLNTTRDEQYNSLALEFKLEADDGTTTILRKTEFGTSAFYNQEDELFYIPPKSGRLWWRITNFSIASNSDVRRNGEWTGGITISNGYAMSDTAVVVGEESEPYIPMQRLGNPDWDIEEHFRRYDAEYTARLNPPAPRQAQEEPVSQVPSQESPPPPPPERQPSQEAPVVQEPNQGSPLPLLQQPNEQAGNQPDARAVYRAGLPAIREIRSLTIAENTFDARIYRRLRNALRKGDYAPIPSLLDGIEDAGGQSVDAAVGRLRRALGEAGVVLFQGSQTNENSPPDQENPVAREPSQENPPPPPERQPSQEAPVVQEPNQGSPLPQLQQPPEQDGGQPDARAVYRAGLPAIREIRSLTMAENTFDARTYRRLRNALRKGDYAPIPSLLDGIEDAGGQSVDAAVGRLRRALGEAGVALFQSP